VLGVIGVVVAVDLPGAAADCERITTGWAGQPVNTFTSLAFVAAAISLFGSRRPVQGAVMLAIGVGSVAFHGPMPSWGEWLHDASVLAAVGLVIVPVVHATRWVVLIPALAGGLSISPRLGDFAAAGLTVVAVGSVAVRGRERSWLPLTIVGLGALVGRLAATGGPWCDPDTIWQGHGLWHLAAALALWIWWHPLSALSGK
jgi:hypothetical protein